MGWLTTTYGLSLLAASGAAGWLLAAWRGQRKELARARAQFALQLGEWQARYREAKAAQAEAESRQLAAEGSLAAEAGKSAAQRAAIEALQQQLGAAQAAGEPQGKLLVRLRQGDRQRWRWTAYRQREGGKNPVFAAGGPIKGYASRDEARKAARQLLDSRWTLEWDPGSSGSAGG